MSCNQVYDQKQKKLQEREKVQLGFPRIIRESISTAMAEITWHLFVVIQAGRNIEMMRARA